MLLTILAACGNGDTTPTPAPAIDGQTPDAPPGGDGTDEEDGGPPVFLPPDYVLPDATPVARYTPDGRRIIRVASWFDRFFDSTHTAITDDPGLTNPETAQMELDRVRYVEEKYNVFIEFVNMTWEGIMENIPISIMSGIPDAEIYMVNPQFGIPAVLNGFATSLEEMGLSDHPIMSGESNVLTSLHIPGTDNTYLIQAAGFETSMYLMGFNLDMLQAHGLEDPRDLWHRGEWTWERFREYAVAVTDSARNIYGWSGYWTNFLSSLLFSNNAAIAAGPVQTLDHPNTVEVLNFIDQLYNVDRVARPWNPDSWPINNNLFAEGLSGFFMANHWLLNEQSGGFVGAVASLPFEVGVVPFPVGPQGNAETMFTAGADGNFFFIPRFVENPRLVFDVFYDLMNWFDDDLYFRDDHEWAMNSFGTPENWAMYLEVYGRFGFDMWGDLGTGFSILAMIEQTVESPTYTPIQLVETWRQVFQDALDHFFR